MSTEDTLPRYTEFVDRLVSALGGAAAVSAAATETTVADGWRHHPGWGTLPSEPESSAEFSYTLRQDTVAPRYRLALKAKTHLVPAQLDYVETGNGSRGHVDGVDFMFDTRPVNTPIASWRVATRQRHNDLISPLRIARKLLAPEADVSVDDAVLTLREVGRPPLRITLDPATGLPATFAVTEEHSPLGDVLVEVWFGDYREAGALTLPHHVTITIDGVTVHDEVRSSIEISDRADDAEFAVAESAVQDGSAGQVAYAHYSTEWIMTYVLAGVRFYFDLQVAPVTPEAVDLAEGVKLVIGPSHNTMVVEMPDHTLAVEAPLYDEYTHAALAQVKAAFPGKPLRTVVGTHFHYDHIGGLREFAAEGDITVLAGEPTVPFFERIFDGQHTVDPDRFSGNPVPVTVRGVADSLALPMADGGNVELYRISNDHTEDMLIVYLSKAKLVFESDLWNPTPVEPAPNSGRGRVTTQLYEAIVKLGLDVETVVGGHNGTDGKTLAHAAPFSYLKIAAGY
jgi:glyoxylase-like metal-dependent hydrolase (beta-lactamase superfamily II)